MEHFVPRFEMPFYSTGHQTLMELSCIPFASKCCMPAEGGKHVLRGSTCACPPCGQRLCNLLYAKSHFIFYTGLRFIVSDNRNRLWELSNQIVQAILRHYYRRTHILGSGYIDTRPCIRSSIYGGEKSI